jgi:hypothetical protein
MVRTGEINHLEQNILGPAILPGAEQNINPDLAMSAHDTPDTMPWKVVRLGSNIFSVIPNLSIVSRYKMLMLLPPSIKTRVNLTLMSGPMNVGTSTRA